MGIWKYENHTMDWVNSLYCSISAMPFEIFGDGHYLEREKRSAPNCTDDHEGNTTLWRCEIDVGYKEYSTIDIISHRYDCGKKTQLSLCEVEVYASTLYRLKVKNGMPEKWPFA